MTNFKDLDFLVESLRKVDTGKNHILITLEQIGIELNLTRERVRQKVAKIIF